MVNPTSSQPASRNAPPEPLILRETLNGIPVRFTIYTFSSRIRNTAHRLISPVHPYTWFVVGEVDTSGMSDAEFFASSLSVFEAVWWQGSTRAGDYDMLLSEVRHLAAVDIVRRKPVAGSASVIV